ncbi:methyltransferase, FkbM family [Cyclobacterium lianum]|uniref:Methyltransferase, FkbM family n=1 Tax=Cyclobacterium lianum TaxID=388280 RepID=A0A1M7PWG7_9BACT|nr:FkbM family methyltransferase [Cyclobacterium lianum]SHN21934.1 methyltransferase, FkbM family [Cyclobacterium lianum]
MSNRIEAFLSILTRELYRVPGGYFIVQFVKNRFCSTQGSPDWRTFRFRGITFKVDITKGMGNAIFWRGAHDWAPLFVLERVLQKGATFIDVGANQGEYTLWGLRKVGPQGKVIAYEPSERLFRHLEENLGLNPEYKQVAIARKMGLSDAPGKLKLYTKSGINEGVNSMFPSEEHDIFLNEIELSTLDKEVEILNLQAVDCLKIDVEGAELHVLRGAERTIKKFKPVIITEVNQTSCEAAGYETLEILEFLKDRNYKLFKIGLRGKLDPIRSMLISEFSNVVAFPE